jgi:hypothetical protein
MAASKITGMAAKYETTKRHTLKPTATSPTRPVRDLHKATICVLGVLSSDDTQKFWLCEKLSAF